MITGTLARATCSKPAACRWLNANTHWLLPVLGGFAPQTRRRPFFRPRLAVGLALKCNGVTWPELPNGDST